MIQSIVEKSMAGELLNEGEIAELFQAPLFGDDAARIIRAGREKSEKACDGLAEVHGQVGLNIAPCPRNCKFCAFAALNGVFTDRVEIPMEEAIARARQFEADGANAIFVMATADYPFSRFVERCREIRRSLSPETVLIANVGDFTAAQAQRLKDAGISGVYHAVRLGEGRDTTIQPEKRLATIRAAHEVGLSVGTCLEPVGHEHSVDELVEKTIMTRDAQPCYSGSARRIPIPDTEMAAHGIVSEARMALILAVVRLALGYEIPGNCTHEPNSLGCFAGANLLWAESGSNPRDTEEDTEGQRGMTVGQCRTVLQEAEWRVLDGPSRFYAPNGR